MKSRIGRRILAIVTSCSLIVLLTSPASAYFERGMVGLSLGSSGVTLYEGDSQSVSVSFSPSSSDQTLGCGMEECPRICGEKGCLDENGECTCAGPEYTTYYASADVSSSNSSVASASYSSGTVSIYAYGAGTATIEVTSELRQFTSETKTIQVTVLEKEKPAESSSGDSGSSNASGNRESANASDNRESTGQSASSAKASDNSKTQYSGGTGNSKQIVSSARVSEKGTVITEDGSGNGSSNVTEISVTENRTDANTTQNSANENLAQSEEGSILSEDVAEAGKTAGSKAGKTTASKAVDGAVAQAEDETAKTTGRASLAAGIIVAAAAVAAAGTALLLQKKKQSIEAGNSDD